MSSLKEDSCSTELESFFYLLADLSSTQDIALWITRVRPIKPAEGTVTVTDVGIVNVPVNEIRYGITWHNLFASLMSECPKLGKRHRLI
jgi:hypothetical protein